MQSATEIVQELNRIARYSVWAAIIVRFEENGDLITAGEGDPLALLQPAIRKGGQPIGFLCLGDTVGGSRVLLRPLPHLAKDVETMQYLEGIQTLCLDLNRARGIPARQVFPERN